MPQITINVPDKYIDAVMEFNSDLPEYKNFPVSVEIKVADRFGKELSTVIVPCDDIEIH